MFAAFLTTFQAQRTQSRRSPVVQVRTQEQQASSKQRKEQRKAA